MQFSEFLIEYLNLPGAFGTWIHDIRCADRETRSSCNSAAPPRPHFLKPLEDYFFTPLWSFLNNSSKKPVHTGPSG